ncbi:MAG TPA: anti-sigma factor [Ferruginibacter sp.]|nr:anti-sigma factor [Ferruginibacter sp.]HMP20106.1 anti-sigma factor [Ferruginibacter sp.]
MDAKDIISSGLLELYAAGLTSAEESLQVQQYVQLYPEVAAELAAIEAGVEAFATAMPVTPAPEVKEKIFARINETAKPVPITAGNDIAPVVTISSRWKSAAAAAILLLVGSAAVNIYLYNRNNNMQAQLQQVQNTVASLQEKNKEMDTYLEAVRNRYSTPVSLSGLSPEAADATAKVYWIKNTGDVYVDASSLPAAPAGKQYELWAIVDGKPVNAGIIVQTPSGKTYQIQKMKAFGNAQAFAISLEKESATPADTPTEVYALGKM